MRRHGQIIVNQQKTEAIALIDKEGPAHDTAARFNNSTTVTGAQQVVCDLARPGSKGCTGRDVPSGQSSITTVVVPDRSVKVWSAE